MLSNDFRYSVLDRALGTWRLFPISTKQIWLWNGGQSWTDSHYLFAPKG